jgi:dihydrolipoamide dehydrogenase
MTRKLSVVRQLVSGIEGLLKANKVTVHQGKGTLLDTGTVALSTGEKLNGDAIILATGSETAKLNFPGADLPGVIDSTAALSLEKIPESMIIVGGGVIGIEFAAAYSAFGSKVTVVEMLPEILPPVDGEIAALVKQEMLQKGIRFMNKAQLKEVVKKDGLLCARVLLGEKIEELSAELVLIAVGRRARTENIGLEQVGIQTERGKIKVDNNFRTNVENIYAVGDCNGKMMLAHAASAQGLAAVEHTMGYAGIYNGHTVPSCIYTHPEISGVGLTEEQVKAKGVAYKVGRFPLAGNGKAIIECGGKGMIKIIAGAKYGEILGVHMFGPRVTDMIAEAALAIRLEATVEEIVSTVHAHPTVSEAVDEAALAVDGMSIHWPPPTKKIL